MMVGCFVGRCCCSRCRVLPVRYCRQQLPRNQTYYKDGRGNLAAKLSGYHGNTSAHTKENGMNHHSRINHRNIISPFERYNRCFDDVYPRGVREVAKDFGREVAKVAREVSGGQNFVYDLSSEVLRVFPGIKSSSRTTDHYSHWYDNKSCGGGRINSGNLKDNMLGNIDVPSLYTTVTPKSFIPPSPLRTKQFVMPLKLQQLEPQKKPIGNSDLTVTFVHRKMSENSGTIKNSCSKTTGTSTTTAPPPPPPPGIPNSSSSSSSSSTKPSQKSTGYTKQKSPPQQPQQPGYPDPTENAPVAFINRLAEMTSHQVDTVRLEKSKRGKVRTRVS